VTRVERHAAAFERHLACYPDARALVREFRRSTRRPKRLTCRVIPDVSLRASRRTRMSVVLAGWLRCRSSVPTLFNLVRRDVWAADAVTALVEIGGEGVLNGFAGMALCPESGLGGWGVDGLRRLKYRGSPSLRVAIDALCDVIRRPREPRFTVEIAADALVWIGGSRRSVAIVRKIRASLRGLLAPPLRGLAERAVRGALAHMAEARDRESTRRQRTSRG
jgi:hypothetical protein